MAVSVNTEKCTGCKICVDVCPIGIIKVDGKATVQKKKCIECGACTYACPAGAIGSAK